MLPDRLLAALRYIKNEVFDGYARTSYSQEGEDRILQRVFEGRRGGFYVDVGAHHLKRFSNTYLFYRRGWRGINIEPDPRAMALFNRVRGKDINLGTAISERSGTATYYMFDEPALNTLDAALVENRLGNSPYRLIGRCQIELTTLEAVLRRWLPAGRQIDFLSVDAEGHDLSVLRSSDWNAYRPSVVLVEALDAMGEEVFRGEIHKFMESVGYVWLARTMNTILYVEPDAGKSLALAPRDFGTSAGC
jgi:FkbM family methyltransferase